MDIDAFDGPIKEKRKSYQVDFTTLSKHDVEKAMDENTEYITGIFGIEVCGLCGNSGIVALLIGFRSPKLPQSFCDISNGTRRRSRKSTWITKVASTPKLEFLLNPPLPDRPLLALLGPRDEPPQRLQGQRSRSRSKDRSFARFASMTPRHGHLLLLAPTSSALNAGLRTRQTRSGPRVNLR